MLRRPARSAQRATLLATLVCTGNLAPPTPAQSVTGGAEGRILCADGNGPARGAQVELVPVSSLLPGDGKASSGSFPHGESDFNGLYTLRGVPPGTYLLHIRVPGYVDDYAAVEDQLQHAAPEGKQALLDQLTQIAVRPGAPTHHDVVMRRAGTISGTVLVDMGGTLPPGLRVQATLLPAGAAAGSRPTAAAKSHARTAPVDDRGAYRLPGLPAGDHQLSVHWNEAFFDAIIGGANQVTVVPTRAGSGELRVFAPDALTEAEARPVSLAEGSEVRDADITIPSQRLHIIAGTVVRGGAPASRVSLHLLQDGQRVQTTDALTLPDGSFQIDLVPDGTYDLVAKTYSAGKETGASTTPILVQGGDVANVVIDLARASNKTP